MAKTLSIGFSSHQALPRHFLFGWWKETLPLLGLTHHLWSFPRSVSGRESHLGGSLERLREVCNSGEQTCMSFLFFSSLILQCVFSESEDSLLQNHSQTFYIWGLTLIKYYHVFYRSIPNLPIVPSTSFRIPIGHSLWD